VALKVGILCGGKSAERKVSLKSGDAVFKALLKKGYNAVKLDPADDNFVDKIRSEKLDVAFVALHGEYGEDGIIQGFLEVLGIPYTGSKVLASAVAMDKIMTKKILDFSNIPTPEFYAYTDYEIEQLGLDIICSKILAKFSLPLIIKAPKQGSSIGVVLVERTEILPQALKEVLKYDKTIMIEQFIDGAEITVPVIGNDRELKILPQIEIVPVGKLYDYDAKYTAGMSKHIIPPNIPSEYLKKTAELAQRAYHAIGCTGIARVDFIVNKLGKAYVLEINTSPGMTDISLVPDSAKAAGIEFADLVDMSIKFTINEK